MAENGTIAKADMAEVNRRGLGFIASGSPFTLEDACRVAKAQNIADIPEGDYTVWITNPETRAVLLRVHAELSVEWGKAMAEALTT